MPKKRNKEGERELKRVTEAARRAKIAGPMGEDEVEAVVASQKKESAEEFEKFLDELRYFGERGRRK